MKIKVNLTDLTVWHAARGQWGKSHEMGMATEELAETIVAINHLKRDRLGSPESFILEWADACVCNFQMIENNGWWPDFEAALEHSFIKLSSKLTAHDKNEGHS